MNLAKYPRQAVIHVTRSLRRIEVVAWLKLWHCDDSLIFHQVHDHGPLDFYRDAHCRDAQ